MLDYPEMQGILEMLENGIIHSQMILAFSFIKAMRIAKAI